jgi:hypothetical protein
MGKPTPDLAGQTFDRLTVVERNGVVNHGAAWLCRCSCGNLTTVKGRRLIERKTRSCGCLRAELLRSPVTDAPTYATAHARVYAARGSAADHTCTDCPRPAQQWSYDHTDPDEMTRPDGAAYSGNPEHYAPRCIPCHRRFDTRREITTTALEGARHG